MTNGEKIQSLFTEPMIATVLSSETGAIYFDWDWWYAEYKEPIKALEQKPVIDKIRERVVLEGLGYSTSSGYYKAIMKVLDIIDKYKAESENTDGNI